MNDLAVLAAPPTARTPTSSAAPWWASFVDVSVELGIGAGLEPTVIGRWDSSHWDEPATGVWSGVEPVWVRVDPCRLLDVGITRGRARWIDRFGASSSTLTVDDPDGALSWDADVDDDQLELRPGRQVRIRACLDATGEVFPLWRGWLEAIQDGFAPGYPPPAQLTCQDLLAQIAHVDLPEQEPVGGGERSDERIDRLLDLAEVPSDWRDLDHGRITVQATNLARPVVDDIGVTADSEGGAVFVDREGNVCFRNRDWLRVAPEAVEVQATIGGPDESVCGAEYQLVRSGTDIVNDVQVARAGGTLQRVTNEASIARYRRRTWSRSDYVMETDTQAQLLASRIVNARGWAGADDRAQGDTGRGPRHVALRPRRRLRLAARSALHLDRRRSHHLDETSARARVGARDHPGRVDAHPQGR